MTPADLIAKLEVATGPERALDDAIWALMYKGYSVRWRDDARPEFAVPHCHCSTSKHKPGEEHWQSFEAGAGGPGYTSSLDAALRIVPEGYTWTLYSDASMEIGAEPHPGQVLNGIRLDGETLPLAICIGALRVRNNP